MSADTYDFWSKEFPITSITRADLISAGFDQSIVASLTDHDLQAIASAMENVYCDNGYWEDLELCTKRILERKEEVPNGKQNSRSGEDVELT